MKEKTMKLVPSEVDQFNPQIHNDQTTWPQITVFNQLHHGLVSKDQKYGLINPDGEVIFDLVYDKIIPANNSRYGVVKDGKWGFVDTEENVIIPLEYDLTSDFFDGLCAVKLNERWGYINEQNKVVIPIEYDGCSDFNNGFAGVAKDGKWGAINKQNEIVIPFDWHYMLSIGNGYFTMGEKTKIKVERPDILARYPYFGTADYYLIKFGLLDMEGKVVSKCVSEIPITQFEKGRPVVRINYEFGTLDNFKHFIKKPKYKANSYDLKILRRLGVIEK
ncbi:WG repeat-containing protein [Weeksella virosa]|uniref:WG repeat-containing protein n=1 Tax=Weeksella virosa TaxID=1014 RepID=UPI00255272B5|nr:WG repeat-containing protein [Weeksella virosa]MDK7675270.1 WG repeat-containing protein [Weeksella virosa]